jgi:hypothetical protein
MRYSVDIDSGVMMYIPSFIRIGSGIVKLMGGTHTNTHRQQSDFISLLSLFCKNKSRHMRSPCSLCTSTYQRLNA